MKKLADFTGGLNVRLSEHLIKDNQGVVYENIDNSKGSLVPVRGKLATSDSVDLWFTWFYEDEEWVSFPDNGVGYDFVEFQDVLYFTDRIGELMRRSKGVVTTASLKPLEKAPTLENVDKVASIEGVRGDYRTDVIVSGGIQPSTYHYLLFIGKRREDNTGDAFSHPLVITAKVGKSGTSQNVFEILSSTSTVYDSNYVPIGGLQGDEEVSAGDTIEIFRGRVRFFHPITAESEAEWLELYRYFDDDWRQVRVVRLSDDITLDNLAVRDEVYDIGDNTSIRYIESTVSPFDGTYTYVVTAYNENLYIESAPSPVSEEIKASSGHIIVTINNGFTDTEFNQRHAEVTHWRIYRLGRTVTTFRLVAEIPKSQLVFRDTILDENLTDFLATQENGTAPLGLKYIVESYAMLFGADGSNLRFTGVGEPSNWSELYFIEYDDDITGIASVSNGVLVFTRNKTHLVTGTTPLSLVSQTLATDRGCVSHDSIAAAGIGSVIWSSNDGLCTSNGGNITNITKEFLGEFAVQGIVKAANYKETYYLQLDTGRIFVWDYSYNSIPYFLDLGSTFLYGRDDHLFLRDSTGLLHQAFQSEDLVTFNFKSKKFAGASYSISKTYNKIYIIRDLNEGDINFSVTLDGLKSTETFEYTLTNEKREWELLVPQSFSIAYSIQFTISGSNVVEEVFYTEENTLGEHYAE